MISAFVALWLLSLECEATKGRETNKTGLKTNTEPGGVLKRTTQGAPARRFRGTAIRPDAGPQYLRGAGGREGGEEKQSWSEKGWAGAAAVAKAGGGLGAAGVVIIMLWRPARSTMSLLFLM